MQLNIVFLKEAKAFPEKDIIWKGAYAALRPELWSKWNTFVSALEHNAKMYIHIHMWPLLCLRFDLLLWIAG